MTNGQMMLASLTEKEFSKHLNTKFRVKLDTEQPIELVLVEIKGYPGTPEEQSRMERFSAYFKGSTDVQLPQRTYVLEHERMGEFEIFIVPIARDEQGFRYEAVFNYFK